MPLLAALFVPLLVALIATLIVALLVSGLVLRLAFGTLVAIVARLIVAVVVIGRAVAVFAIALTALGPAIVTTLASFVLTNARIGDHPEVMVRELQVILLIDAIPIEMRIMSEFTIFLQHLRSIATCAAIDPVELLSTAVLTVVVTAAAPAVIATIIVQGIFLNTQTAGQSPEDTAIALALPLPIGTPPFRGGHLLGRLVSPVPSANVGVGTNGGKLASVVRFKFEVGRERRIAK